jgi:hypothetical protein
MAIAFVGIIDKSVIVAFYIIKYHAEIVLFRGVDI